MAEQYDNTNSGAAFPPFPTQTMILQGNVDINSKDHRIILVQNTTKDGRKTIEVYRKL